MTFRKMLIVAVALALYAVTTNAANSLIAAELFAKHPEYTSAMLSPTGDYVSVVTPFEDRRALSIIKLSGNFDRSMIKFKAPETVASARWTDDQRLMVVKAKDFGFLEAPMLTGDVYAADADAKHQEQLFGYVKDDSNFRARLKDRGSVSFMQLIPNTQGEALFYYSPWLKSSSASITSVFRVDTHTGSRKQIESIADNVAIIADNSGTPRFALGDDMEGEPTLRYRPHANDTAWLPVPKTLVGRNMNVWFFEPDNNHAYIEISDKGEAAVLYRVDVAAGTRERIAGNPNMEISQFMRAGYQGLPIGVMYDAGKPKIEYLDPKSEWAQLHAGLLKLFQGQLVQFINFTKDNNKVLFYVYSDRHPGAYYIYDRITKKPTMLFESMEWIDPAKMAPTQSIEFKNASGETLFGFFTAPLGKSGPHPLVVIPHGGPFGIHDTWSYDPDVQFLASRGYAVLQVNFRGSGGRGESFERLTYKQWGTGIQDDIADGVRWAISQKLVDAGRVCIYGGSFGGYSALMNPIRNPGMYRCAIGYAGVYDLAEMYKSGDINDNKQGRGYLKRAVSSNPEEQAAQSPARNADKLDIPVLLIHGKSDWRTAIDQYDLMAAALDKAKKPYESLLKANEGHGFYKEENQTEAYRRMEAFLYKYNPVN